MSIRKDLEGPPPEEGTIPWLKIQLAAAEESLLIAEYDVSRLYETAKLLQSHQAWNSLLSDEPKSWERLIEEKIDPQHRRVTWINALIAGYEHLRNNGVEGRITRQEAEAAVNYQHDFLPPSEVSDHQEVAPTHSLGASYRPATLNLKDAWKNATNAEKQAFLDSVAKGE